MAKWTWILNERYRGAELLCDTCNNILSVDIWYLRIPPTAEYPSYAVCGPCKEDL